MSGGSRGTRGGRRPPRSGRNIKQKLKNAKGRKLSSARWLQRQLSDPYVAEARRLGYRSRAAFKLIEMDDRFGFLRPGARVVDLGAAPGGWAQVGVERCRPGGRVVGIDLQPVEPLEGAEFLEGDFLEEEGLRRLKQALGGAADVVLSDMAAPSSGHAPTDHLRIVALAEAALDFAGEVLTQGGAFVAKVLQGGSEASLLQRLKRDFRSVRHVKPPASRADSAELYVVATGFRGGGT